MKRKRAWVVEKDWPHRKLWPADLTKKLHEGLNGKRKRDG